MPTGVGPVKENNEILAGMPRVVNMRFKVKSTLTSNVFQERR